jgi:hypothetical protein
MEILTGKACLEPKTAFAVAEAMDNTIRESQLVTIPVFENGLAELRRDMDAKLAATKLELIRWFAGIAIALATLLLTGIPVAIAIME